MVGATGTSDCGSELTLVEHVPFVLDDGVRKWHAAKVLDVLGGAAVIAVSEVPRDALVAPSTGPLD